MLYEGLMVTNLSGTLDGLVASHNRGGAYFRAHVTPVDPHSAAQVVMRDAMGWVYDNWNTMGQDLRDGWEAYARRHPILNRIGRRHTLSGYNYWTRWALPRRQVCATLFLGSVVGTSPPPNDDAGALQDVTVSWQAANTILRVAWLPNGFEDEDHDYLMLHLATPRGPTINWFRGPYQLIGAASGDPDDPLPSYWDFTLPDAYIPDPGQKLFYRLHFSRQDYDLAPAMTGVLIGT